MQAAPEWINWNKNFGALVKVSPTSISEDRLVDAARHDTDPVWRLLSTLQLLGNLSTDNLKEEVKPTFRLEWEEGDMVRITSGPFADFNGHIAEINVDQSKLKVLVNIFDRETPVELGFDQVAQV